MFKKTFVLIISIIFILITIGCNNVPVEKDVAIAKKEIIQHNWNESTLFESDGITMIGEQGRLGFIYDDNEGLRFYPNKKQKYMWHFWGNEDELIGDFKVLGTHENSDEEIIIVPKTNNSILSPNNGADQHYPTNMMLPKSGMWKLDAYIGESLFGSVYVKVHKK